MLANGGAFTVRRISIQGSTLSPILFLFSNANLVQDVINANRGSVAYVDDYTAWLTGSTTEESTRKVQQRLIPSAEARESESGASFKPEKKDFHTLLEKSGQTIRRVHH
jgi:hypothetical protein